MPILELSDTGFDFDMHLVMIVLCMAFGLLGLRFISETWALAAQAQSLCLQSLGPSSSLLVHALFCGKNPPPGSLKTFATHWGLIHLLVVSGAHLVFLEHHLKKTTDSFKIPRAVMVFIMFLFALATGLAAPMVRACLQALLSWCQKRFYWRWSSAQTTLAAGLLSLAYVDSRQWLSLQLSWCAALLLQVGRRFVLSPLMQSLIIWIVLLPLLAGLTWSHPVSILANAVFASFFEAIVFPFFWIWHNLFWFLQLEPHITLPDLIYKVTPTPLNTPQTTPSSRWIYLILLQGACLFTWKQKNASS